jgi:hypothetical protein
MKSDALRPWPIAAIAILVILTIFRPGDAPFVNDEAIMLETAIRYNHTASNLYGVRLPFTPSPYGLRGGRTTYGPLAIWIDQLFLAFTRDPVTMMAIRAGISAVLDAVALLWLCRTLGFTPWLAVLTMLSPWLWIYARQLWDNDLCVPLSAMMLAAYVGFLATKRRTPLVVTVLCGVMMLLTNFMSLAISIPIAIHLLYFARPQIWKFKWPILAIVVVVAAISWPYWYYLLHYTHLNVAGDNPAWIGWLYPILGGQELTLGIGKIMPGDGWQDAAPAALTIFVVVARWITLLALPAMWIGMILGLPRARRALSSDHVPPLDHLCLIGWAVFITQVILDGVSRINFAPDYFNATWLVFIFFAWLLIETLRRQLREQSILNSYLIFHGALLLICTIIIAATIARNGGTLNDNFGLSLSNQLTAVARIRQFSDQSPLQVDVGQWQRHPLALHVLEELTPPAREPRPLRSLHTQQQNAWPGDAHIVIKDFPPQ